MKRDDETGRESSDIPVTGEAGGAAANSGVGVSDRASDRARGGASVSERGSERVSDDCARAERLLALPEVPDFATEWLANHLDGCDRCGGELESFAGEVGPSLAGEGDSRDFAEPVADAEFFATQHGAIMDSVRAEPGRVSGPGAAGGELDDGGVSDLVISPRPSRVVSLEAAREARRLRMPGRALLARPWIRLAIAASVVAAVSVNVLRNWTPTTLRDPLTEIARVEPSTPRVPSIDESGGVGGTGHIDGALDPNAWLLAASDGLADDDRSGSGGLGELSDEELEELEDALSSEWG